MTKLTWDTVSCAGSGVCEPTNQSTLGIKETGAKKKGASQADREHEETESGHNMLHHNSLKDAIIRYKF